MKFGALMKRMRLSKKMGLRVFADKINEDPGNWCRIEQGRFLPPTDIKVLNKICEVLELTTKEEEEIFDLAAKESKEKIPADIRSQIQENEIIPILFRTIDKKKLSKEQLKKLIDRIKDEY